MDVPLGEVIFFDVITSNPSTGAASDADSTPTFEVFEESTDTDIGVGGNLTKRTSKTGDYRGTFTASTANGFEAGKWYNVVASATVNSVAGKAVAMRFRAALAENVVGAPVVDTDFVGGVAAITFDGTASAGTTTTLTLQSGQSYGTNALRGRKFTVVGGTGAGQSEIIASNTNASPSVLTFARAMLVAPSTDSTYVIGEAAGADFDNVKQASGATSISTDAGGRLDVGKILGTPQTAGRDLGLVLPSAGAGSPAGGLPICHAGTAGEPVVYSDLASIHRTDGGQESANNLYDYWAANGPYAAFAPVRQGTCQASGNTTTAVKLDAGASATDNTRLYVGHVLTFDAGTGAGQAAVITAYSGTTKIATVAPALTTAADGTTRFSILRNLAPALDSSLAVVVGDLTQAALAKFVTTDTGQTTLSAGSVGRLISAGTSATTVNEDVTITETDVEIAA